MTPGGRGRTGIARAFVALLGLGCAAPLGLAPVAAAQDESAVPAVDPRVERADALLEHPESYGEAIALYRAVLADHPADRDVRLRLARVLAWDQQLPASLAEYERILAERPGDAEARLERAEVLSWAGDNQAALAEFDAILRAEPRNARAARGRARSAFWAGRTAQADAAYAHALDLEEDAEAREEWRKLRANFRKAVELRGQWFADSSDVERRDVALEASNFARVDTKLRARIAWMEVSHPQDEVPLEVRSTHDRDAARELALGMDRDWNERLKSTAEIGARDWHFGGDSLFARASLGFSWSSQTSLAVFLERSDFTDASYSFEAIGSDVRQTAGAATVWHLFSPRVSSFSRAELGDVSDGNTRASLYTSLSLQPSLRRELHVNLGANYLSYADPSQNYYDPERDVGVELSVDQSLAAGPELALGYRVGLGFQSTDDRAGDEILSESGTQCSAEGSARWVHGDWTVELRGAVSYAQRASRYHASRVVLRVERKF